jgi:hypothetical protein
MDTKALRTMSACVRLARKTSASSRRSMASQALASRKMVRRQVSVAVTSVPSSPLVTQ